MTGGRARMADGAAAVGASGVVVLLWEGGGGQDSRRWSWRRPPRLCRCSAALRSRPARVLEYEGEGCGIASVVDREGFVDVRWPPNLMSRRTP